MELSVLRKEWVPPIRKEWDTKAARLASLFEEIRGFCFNLPIQVTSAYRTAAHNRKVGGSRNSYHVQGMALDLKPTQMDFQAFVDRVFLYAHQSRGRVSLQQELVNGVWRPVTPASPLRVGGLGIYKTWVHVDLREVLQMVVWYGKGV